MGHRTNAAGWNAGIDSSYDTQNAGNYHLWTSARYGNSAGTRFILWPTGTPQNAYWDGNGVTAGNQRVRCVFPPRDSCPGGNCEDDPAKLYFSDVQHGTITRTDLDGSNSETIISGIDADALALDTSAGKIYWVDSDSAIKRANLDGTLVETVLNNLPSPYGIALDVAGGKMYWTNQSGNPKIQRADFDGGNMVTLVNGSGCCTAGIALDVAGSRMYWVDGYYNGNIVRANLDGSNSQNIATTTGIPTGIALDTGAGKVYWSEYGNGNDDFIRRANLDGSNVEALLSHASGLETPQHIALDVDNGKMYFADLHNHKIFTANLNGSGLTTLIDGLGYPRGIALDL
jgi:DNA-binding beta-propeller fold protein YncE